MRFDPERALTLARELDQAQGAEVGRFLLDALAARLAGVGLRVEALAGDSHPIGVVGLPVPRDLPGRRVVFAVGIDPRGPSVDRCGSLGLLNELARSWPRSSGQRLEVGFAAVLGAAGEEDLFRWARAEVSGPLPTLIIRLGSTASGRCVAVSARGAGWELARAAAADLWIPHRMERSIWRPLSWWRAERGGLTVIRLASSPKAARPPTPSRWGTGHPPMFSEGAMLGALAQLATEIALRWGRRQAGPAGDDRVARSSQNPG
ncbi:MAG: hypothetical protein IRY99_15465 [Isosphaeraceae bacterium]|nr:hypothetical protein [Isosphaeraceae bacterium]